MDAPRFRILGRIEVELSPGVRAHVARGRARSLLALLLVQRGAMVSHDRILDELWGERWPANGPDAVYVVASRLRAVLPPGVLAAPAGGYAVPLGRDALDADRFERLLRRGREELAAGQHDEAAATLREALALWRGPALADVAATPVAAAEARRLEGLRLDALRHRLDADLAGGRHGEVVGELQALVAAHPDDETLCGQLMLALYRSGRQVEALAAFRAAREALRDGHGLEASTELRALERAILRQEVALPASPAPLAPRRDRRRVTCVFALLDDGAGERGPGRDPEALDAEVARAHDALGAACARHGGTVVERRVDGLLAVFGSPVAREDDALRGLRTALAMRDGAVAAGWPATGVGVATGDVVAATGGVATAAPIGDVVPGAERLARSAAPGRVLVAGETWPLVRHAGRGRRLRDGSVELRDVEADALPIARRLDAPLVGRHVELQALATAVARVTARRRGELLTILGEPGIGKSRLVHELERLAGPGTTVLRGRAAAYGDGVTFLPLRQAVAQAAAGRTSVELARALQLDPAVVVQVATALGLEDGDRGESVGGAAARLLAALAAQRPLALVVDDAHWAEPAMLDVLLELARALRDEPVLLVCVARPELLEARPGWPCEPPGAVLLSLGPLSLADSETLLEGLPGAPDPVHARRLALAAGGNPLFLEQLAAYVDEHGTGTRLPPALQPLLAARLDGLGATERLVLARGAVEGEAFRLERLRAITPELPLAELGAAAAELEQRDLIVRSADGEVRFRHSLIRDVAYGTLPKAQRAELHERLAAELAERPDGLPEPDATVGLHLELAHGLAREAGADPRDLASRAGARLAAAARLAHARGDVPGAIGFIRRARALLGAETPGAVALLPDLASALFEAGAFDEAALVAEQAVAAAAGLDLPATHARATVERERMRLCRTPWTFRPPESRRVIAQAMAALASEGDDLGLARAEYLMQDLAWLDGDVVGTEHHLQRMRDHARQAGSSFEVAVALSCSGWNLVEGSLPVGPAVARCDALLRDAAGQAAAVLSLQGCRAALVMLESDGRSGRTRMADARQRLSDLGLRELTAYLALLDGTVNLVTGDHDGATRAALAAAAVFDGSGDCWLLATARADTAIALLAGGHRKEARTALARLDDAPATCDRGWLVKRHAAHAALASADGDHESAVAEAGLAVGAIAGTGLAIVGATALHVAADVLLRAGRAADALEAHAQAVALDVAKGVRRRPWVGAPAWPASPAPAVPAG